MLLSLCMAACIIFQNIIKQNINFSVEESNKY
jgi:hypothetical protein